MKPIGLFLISLLILSCGKADKPLRTFVAATPETVPYYKRLRRLSFRLRGFTPSAKDNEELYDALAEGKSEAYFQKKTQEYLKSPEYVGKIIDEVNELFRLKLAVGFPENQIVPPLLSREEPGNESHNAFDLTVESIARDNLSWDLLLTSTGYRLGDHDRYFFSALYPAPPAEGLPLLQFEANDPRVAGVITTSRFFNRFSTTSKNKSRGRAAALFRVFLCDEMAPIVVSSAEGDKALVDLAFSDAPAPLKGIRDPHGTQASCLNCHHKLDPMGRTFLTSTTILSPFATPGALVYERPNGAKVNVPSRGLGDLARALATQPEFEKCQVGHFWKWFVRADTMPTPPRMAELVSEFKRVGHRLNEFVGYLVNQPEFYDAATSEVHTPTVPFSQVRPILNRCDSCHDGMISPLPPFTTMPIEGASQNLYWLTRIAARLDLPGKGVSRSMPPPYSPWQPSPQEIESLIHWVRSGAPAENGQPTLDPDTAYNLVKPR